jgi:hypothetical protein
VQPAQGRPVRLRLSPLCRVATRRQRDLALKARLGPSMYLSLFVGKSGQMCIQLRTPLRRQVRRQSPRETCSELNERLYAAQYHTLHAKSFETLFQKTFASLFGSMLESILRSL